MGRGDYSDAPRKGGTLPVSSRISFFGKCLFLLGYRYLARRHAGFVFSSELLRVKVDPQLGGDPQLTSWGMPGEVTCLGTLGLGSV